MHRFAISLGFAVISSTPLLAADNVQIDYVLPAVNVTAGVSHRITKCPVAGELQAEIDNEDDERLKISFAIKTMIAGKAIPGRLVMLDAGTGFLVDRETKVHFNDDWYLKDFNGKTTGQGGPLLISLIKAGAAIAGMTADPIEGLGAAKPPAKPQFLGGPVHAQRHYASKYYLECKPEVVKALIDLEKRREDVLALETRVIGGDVSAATQEMLALRRSQVGELEAGLTINATLKGGLTPRLDTTGKALNLTGQMPAPDFEKLLQVRPIRREVKTAAQALVLPAAEPSVEEMLARQKRRIPGAFGYQVSIEPNSDLSQWFGCAEGSPRARSCAAEQVTANTIRSRDLIYLRPIPAAVKTWPNPIACPAAQVCKGDDSWIDGKSASGSGEVKLPQLSRLYRMPTGGSIFGGRTVGAEFGAFGEPTMLQYDIGGGAKDVAGVVDASVAGAQTIRDAPGAATKRKLDNLKNARDLEDLIEELDQDKAQPATPEIQAPGVALSANRKVSAKT